MDGPIAVLQALHGCSCLAPARLSHAHHCESPIQVQLGQPVRLYDRHKV